jgi:hypothetical protein
MIEDRVPTVHGCRTCLHEAVRTVNEGWESVDERRHCVEPT